MTIIEQLDKLAETAPDACRQDDGVFVIGDYHFWDSSQYGFCAGHIQAVMGLSFKGRPALDWLEGALRQVIEGEGRDWELRYISPIRAYQCQIHNRIERANTPAEALLAALIAAVEER